MTRLTLPLIFMAGPAFAHHEVVAVSVLPGLVVWLTAISAVGLTAWKQRRRRD